MCWSACWYYFTFKLTFEDEQKGTNELFLPEWCDQCFCLISITWDSFIFKLSGFRLVLIWFPQGFNVLGVFFVFISSCPLDILVGGLLLIGGGGGQSSASFYLLLQLSPQPKYDERLPCVLFLWLTKANRLFVFLFSVTAENAVQEPAVWRSRCLSCLPALCSNHQKFQINQTVTPFLKAVFLKFLSLCSFHLFWKYCGSVPFSFSVATCSRTCGAQLSGSLVVFPHRQFILFKSSSFFFALLK